MAKKAMTWNINCGENYYKIEADAKQVTINNGEPVKLKSLPRETDSMVESHFTLPIQEAKVVLHFRQMCDPVLTVNGRNCVTGEEHVPAKVPGWVWVFIVLHAFNFFLLIGGAVGGALQGLAVWLFLGVASSSKMTTPAKVLSCIGIWALSTLVQFVLAVILLSL